tara:strand:+ start:566 stop:1063 length:498 start_codon:yes stop_codon:yes gene_type:complete
MNDLPEYRLERVFDAPRTLVWRTWTEPELLARWYGPGVETIIHRFDLEPGGEWRNEMKWGEKSFLSKMVFQEVVPPEKLVWHHSSTDTDWNIISNPMMPGWPDVLLTTVVFEEDGAKTNVSLTMAPLDATETEAASFAEAMSNMDSGWGKGYAVLDELIDQLKNQ